MSELDPFEARINFLGLLQKLNASQHSIQKVASFAMRYRSMHEDLFNCIIEALDQTSSINARMNIFYVFDSICQQSSKAVFSGYTDLIAKNLASIIESVAPSGPKGNVNVAGTKRILDLWRAKNVISSNVIDIVEKPLLARELGDRSLTSEAGMAKEDILRRMEEDRERHKRIREEIWIRPPDEDPSAEFQQDWDEVSDIDEHDYEDIQNENSKYLPGYPWDMEFDASIPAMPPNVPASSGHLSASIGATTNTTLAASDVTATSATTSATGAASITGTSGTTKSSSAIAEGSYSSTGATGPTYNGLPLPPHSVDSTSSSPCPPSFPSHAQQTSYPTYPPHPPSYPSSPVTHYHTHTHSRSSSSGHYSSMQHHTDSTSGDTSFHSAFVNGNAS